VPDGESLILATSYFSDKYGETNKKIVRATCDVLLKKVIIYSMEVF